MKHPWLSLIVSGIVLILLSLLLLPSVEVEEIAPAGAGALVKISDPINIIEKMAGSELVRTMARMPALEPIAYLLTNWEKIKEETFFYSALLFFFKDVHVAIPADLSRYSLNEMPFTTYLDLGMAGRLISMVSRLGIFAQSRSYFRHRGHLMYHKGNQAAVFIRNMVILGSEKAVISAIDTYEGGKPSLQDNALRYEKSLNLVDSQADISVMLLSRSYFRAAESPEIFFDPRALISAPAVEAAVVNISIEDDGFYATLELQPFSGKVISRYTQDQQIPFKTLVLPDDGTMLYAAIRVEDPAAFGTLLLDTLSGDKNVKALRRKMASLILNSFLEYVDREMAVVIDADNPGKMPTMVLQVTDAEKVRAFFDKMAKAEMAKTSLLNRALGENGQELLEMLAENPTPANVEKLLNLLPVNLHAEVRLLAEKLREGAVSPDQVGLDEQRIGLFGYGWYWRMIEGNLILAPMPDLADRYEKNLQAGKPPKEFSVDNPAVPTDGSLVAWFNLAQVLNRLDPEREKPASWLAAKHPHVVVGVKSDTDRFVLAMQLPLKLDLTTFEARGSIGWKVAFYVLGALLYVLLAFCLLIFTAAVWNLLVVRRRR